MTPEPQATHIDASAFDAAVECFIDENKPDVLCQEQMREWTFEWSATEMTNPQTTSSWSKLTNDKGETDLPFQLLSGSLFWNGSYVSVCLDTTCFWNGEKEGSLFFQCCVTKAELQTQSSDSSNSNNNKRVRIKMEERLQKDSYLQKLLKPTSPLEVCEAIISFKRKHNQSQDCLEERVHWNESVVESIRRAVFSQSESTLDVLDLILNLPFLPTTPATEAARNSPSQRPATHLADRAKLRLLEDALYDACEQEEEDELVKGLHINKKTKI